MLSVMEVQDVVRSRLKVLIHERNTERVRYGKKPLTIRRISELTSLSTSAITGLTTNRIVRYDSETLQKLCRFFNCTPGDILEYVPENEDFRPGDPNQYLPSEEELARHVKGHAAITAATGYAQRKLLQDPWLDVD
jgi:putative transcriptional regulator